MERFYDPVEGKMWFNDDNIADLDNAWYHQTQVGLVQQEPILFSGSIRSNILYGCQFDHLTDEEKEEKMIAACKQASCYDFIMDKSLFPDGFDQPVGERGSRLSGGQKQRIAIARGLVRDPRVLLLDEATSALDAESEYQVQTALDALIAKGTQTIVVIAHRLSTIVNADKIIVLKKGEVIETGTHTELVRLNGAYKKLVERQMMTEELGEKVTK
jgi:ABC-type multidrug transport system fused ATPase/permease subunit